MGLRLWTDGDEARAQAQDAAANSSTLSAKPPAARPAGFDESRDIRNAMLELMFFLRDSKITPVTYPSNAYNYAETCHRRLYQALCARLVPNDPDALCFQLYDVLMPVLENQPGFTELEKRDYLLYHLHYWEKIGVALPEEVVRGVYRDCPGFGEEGERTAYDENGAALFTW